MSDPRFLQQGIDPQLSHLVEEMGEALAAAGKSLRWGIDSVNPDLPDDEQETNLAWLRREMTDVIEAWDRLSKTIADEGYDQ